VANANPIAQALISKMQMSLIDRIITEFIESANQRLEKHTPRRAMTFGNKLIDDLNNNSVN